MTTTTKKVLIAIFLGLLFCGIVVLGVFEFIPDYEVGEYGIYQSISERITKSGTFTDTKKATYTVELDEGVDIKAVQSAIKARLQKSFGYYGVQMCYDEASNQLTITIPNNGLTSSLPRVEEDEDGSVVINRGSLAKSVLERVSAVGKLEVLNSSSYSDSAVILKEEHFKRATVKTYVSGTNTWYICQVRLTAEGTEIANGNFTVGSTYYYAVDGAVENIAVYSSNGTFQLYSHEKEEADIFAGYVKTGSLGATLTLEESVDVVNSFGWIYMLIFCLVVVASFVYAAVRYKGLSVVPILMQLLAIVIYVLFAGLAYTEIFNVASAIGTFIVYAFMSFFSWMTFERIRARLADNKTYTWARHMAFDKRTNIISLIAHGALLVLGIILWVIPSVVTAPLGCVFVYGAVLSFVVTFGLNRLFTLALSPYFENVGRKAKASK